MEFWSRPPSLRSARWLVVVAGLAVCLSASACGGSDDEGARPGADELASADESGGGTGTGEGADEPIGSPPEELFDGSVTVVVPNSPGTLSTGGRQRVMAALVGDGPSAYLGGPELAVTARYSYLDGELTDDVTATWLATAASDLGLYVAPYSFERAGLWELTVLADDREIGAALVEVVEDSAVPTVGDPAPTSVTPTGSTVEELAAISTDPSPDPGFYDLSLDEALANGRPTVVAFATPAFCRTALCGPTLELVKAATAGRDDVDVVHIEPYDIEAAIGGVLEPIPAMDDWGLVTEPWVFVVDADGLVAAGLEGIMGVAELEAALDQL